MTTLLTLPPHLLETIQDLLSHDVDLPNTLREDLSRAVRQRQHVFEDDDGSNKPIINGGDEAKEPEEEGVMSDQERTEEEQSGAIIIAGITPLTIPHETIEELSRWAGSSKGHKQIRKRGLDPNRYNTISLLSGTEIYIPSNELERLKLAENPDKPNPYLPSYLSPSTPSFGGEYRKLSKQISTILNILFSIFGSAAAIFIVSKSSAGYSTEVSLLLAILTGVIVGLADLVLVYLFTKKVNESRRERWKFGLRMLKGTGRVDEGEDGKVGETGEGGEGEGEGEGEEEGGEGENIDDLEEKVDVGSTSIKKDIRLRRRGLHN